MTLDYVLAVFDSPPAQPNIHVAFEVARIRGKIGDDKATQRQPLERLHEQQRAEHRDIGEAR